jgi:hypothetical protein
LKVWRKTYYWDSNAADMKVSLASGWLRRENFRYLHNALLGGLL